MSAQKKGAVVSMVGLVTGVIALIGLKSHKKIRNNTATVAVEVEKELSKSLDAIHKSLKELREKTDDQRSSANHRTLKTVLNDVERLKDDLTNLSGKMRKQIEQAVNKEK